MTDRELLQQALDALDSDNPDVQLRIATALRARLSQCDRCGEVNPAEIHTCTPKQEPVAWMYNSTGDTRFAKKLDTPGMHRDESVPLYTAPPQREWQGLTDEERIDCEIKTQQNYFYFARYIEAKLKEKNT